MKKILSLFWASCFCVALVGCGGGDSAPAPSSDAPAAEEAAPAAEEGAEEAAPAEEAAAE